MSSFRDDQAVAARILAHIEAHTTDTGDAVWREPVANYRSPERLRAELEVLRREPRALCPSAAVREIGQFLTVRADGRSIVIVRGEDGAVRGLLNACRHRGNEVSEGGAAPRRSCAATTAGPTASTARSATSRTTTASPGSTTAATGWRRSRSRSA